MALLYKTFAFLLFSFSASTIASAITKNLHIRQSADTQCPSQPSSYCICFNGQGTQGPEGKENAVTTALCQALGGTAKGGFGPVDPEYPCGGNGPTVACLSASFDTDLSGSAVGFQNGCRNSVYGGADNWLANCQSADDNVICFGDGTCKN